MKERGFKDRTFRMTGRDLDVYCIYFLMNLLGSLLAGVAELLIIDMTMHDMLGDFEGWVELGVWGFMASISLATSCVAFFLGKLLMEHWLEKKNVPSQGGADKTAEAA